MALWAPELDDRSRGTARSGLRVGVLGALVVEIDGEPVHVAGTHRRRLLALLASRPGRVAPVDAIVDALWGDDPPASAAKTVQSHVVRLRRSLGVSDVVETVPGGYRLRVDPESVDAVRFEQLVADARRSATAGDTTAAAQSLATAIGLFGGPAFLEFRELPFVAGEAVRLDELRRTAIEELAELDLRAGVPANAVPALEHLLHDDPGREQAWALLARALYATGRQHDALTVFQRARHALADRYGLEPGPDLLELERRVLEQSPTLTPTAGRSALAAALRTSSPLVGRRDERAALETAWRSARTGTGQTRIVAGPLDSGRTRLAADLAGVVIADGGSVQYVRATDLGGPSSGALPELVEAVRDQAQSAPLLQVVDDVEWAVEDAMREVAMLASAVEDLPVLLVLVVDPSGGGPAVAGLRRLDPTGALTINVGPLPADEVAAVVSAEGVDADAVAGIVAVSDGLPGVARREAAVWAERTASERLRTAAAASIGATALARRAQGSVLDEVVDLVVAQARRAGLRSEKWAGRQPYRALSSYGPEDAELFVGREQLIAELASVVLERRLCVVVGTSGSGKSSLVRAGLVPLVRSGRLPGDGPWISAVMVPGRDPLAALGAVEDLDETGPRLLVVDQFEEALAALPPVAEHFVERLVDLAGDSALDVHVVIVVRADEYARLTAIPALADAVTSAQVVVGPPTDDELRRIIVEPARRTGIAVEPALVELVVADVDGDAALPLVSSALAEVWQHRDGNVMRAETYTAIGGVGAAVERLGELAVRRAGAEHERALRELLVALADVTDDGVWTRRRLAIDDVPSGPVLDALTETRLVVRDDQHLEIIHEVVFRSWPRLAAWLDEARADIVLERDLRLAARTWDDGGRSTDDLYRGARLVAATELAARRPELTGPVAAFVAAGQGHAEREHDEVRARLVRETRSRRRLGRALVAAAILLVGALVAGGLAIVSQRRADDARLRAADAAQLAERRREDAEAAQAAEVGARADAETAEAAAEEGQQEAEDERDRSRIARLVAESERELGSQLDLGLLLAAESYRRADTVDTRGALLTALTANVSSELPARVRPEVAAEVHRTNSAFAGLMNGPSGRPIGLDVSDDGATVATARYEDDTTCGCLLVLIFDTSSRREIGRFEVPFPAAMGIDLTADGTHVVAASGSDVYLYDVAAASTDVLDARPDGQQLLAPSFVKDGTRFVVPASDGSLTLWDRAARQRIDVALPTSPVGLAGIAPDGTLAIGLADGVVMFWDLDAAAELRRVSLEGFPVDRFFDDFALSSDMSLLAAAEDDGQVYVWQLTTGQPVGDPVDRPGSARSIAWAPGSGTLAIASTGGGISLYDVTGGQRLGQPLVGHGRGRTAVRFSGDGRYLVAAGDDGLVGLWTDNGATGLISEPLAEPGVSDPDYSADGTHVLVSAGGRLHVRAGRDPGGAGVDVTPDELGDRSIAFSALSEDGSTVLAAASDEAGATIFVVDAKSGTTRWTMEPPYLRDASISIDGQTVATTVQRDGKDVVQLWGDAGALIAEFDSADSPGDPIAHAVTPTITAGPEFSPDGQYVDVYLTPTVLRLDADDLSVVAVAESPVVIWALAAVPDSSHIVGVGVGGRAFRWDMATGEVVATGRSRESTRLETVAVSPDSAVVAAIHPEASKLALLDAATLRPIGRPFPVSAEGLRPQFATDGSSLTGNGVWNAIATQWSLDADGWLATACRAAGRNLTAAEWVEYLGPDEPYRPTCPDWPAGDR